MKKYNKGFTLIELLVVVAIIGIITAMIVPMVSNRGGRIDDANNRSRLFYIQLQNIYSDYKLDNIEDLYPDLDGIIPDVDYLYIIAEVDNSGNVVKVTAREEFSENLLNSDGSSEIEQRLLADINARYTDAQSGVYYGKIDSQSRVAITHWQQNKVESIPAGGFITFTENGIADGRVTGTYSDGVNRATNPNGVAPGQVRETSDGTVVHSIFFDHEVK